MRSKLFVPGSRPELFAKALAGSADALSFDLEDAVAEACKAQARVQLATFLEGLATPGKTLVVRINDLSGPHGLADIDAVAGAPVAVINLPKVESAGDVLALVERLDAHGARARHLRILATVETPKGLRNAVGIAAAHPRMMGLQLGLADLFEPLGIDRRDPLALHHVRLAVRLAAGEAGIACYDSASAAIDDAEGFLAEARAARALGFAGKSCIHPRQVAWANQAFQPSAREIDKALRILAAAEQAQAAGVGAYTVDGAMVDGPFVEGARRLVEQARRAGLLDTDPSEHRSQA